jgi:hypothetical protein
LKFQLKIDRNSNRKSKQKTGLLSFFKIINE